MKETKKATKAAGYDSTGRSSPPPPRAKIIPFNRAPGAHAGRIETGPLVLATTIADERDYR